MEGEQKRCPSASVSVMGLFLFLPISGFLSSRDRAGGKGIGEQEEIYFLKHASLGAPRSILNLFCVTVGNIFHGKDLYEINFGQYKSPVFKEIKTSNVDILI